MNLTSVAVTGTKGIVYTVSVDASSGKASCTCPAFYYSGRAKTPCKHILFVASAFAGSKAAKPFAQA